MLYQQYIRDYPDDGTVLGFCGKFPDSHGDVIACLHAGLTTVGHGHLWVLCQDDFCGHLKVLSCEAGPRTGDATPVPFWEIWEQASGSKHLESSGKVSR